MIHRSVYRDWQKERAARHVVRGLGDLGASPPSSIALPPREAAIYSQWARWMLGVEDGPAPGTAMVAADQLFRAQRQAILAVAKELWRALGPAIWPTRTRELYRGIRLADPSLDGQLLPWNPRYAHLAGISYSEELKVACHFADPGKRGFPAVHPATLQPMLPPHGYVLTHNASGKEILLHWRYLLAVPPLFRVQDPLAETPSAIAQKEVTLQNDRGMIERLHAWHGFCGGYIQDRYGGPWEPGDPDPFGDAYVG
jgi:hypothetical protein